MKRTDLFFICAFIILTNSFSSCMQQYSSENLPYLSFDVTGDYSNNTLDIHDIADVDYLVLNSENDYLYTHLSCLTDKYIVALNSNETSFVFFDWKGKPLSKVSRAGEGPEEYKYFWHETYSEDADELYVFSFPNKLQVYNRSGQFKKTLHLNNDSQFASIDALSDFNKDDLLYHLSDSIFQLISKQDGNIREIAVPIVNKVETKIRKKNAQGMNLTIAFDISYGVKSGKEMFLTNYSSDTIYRYTSDCQLKPAFVRTPPTHTQVPPVLVDGFIETDSHLFFSTVMIDYNITTNVAGEQKGYMFDKQTSMFNEVDVVNADFEGQDILITPAMLKQVNSNLPSNNNKVVLRLKTENLLQAKEKGKLNGKLKTIVEQMDIEDPFVLMIITFK